MLWGKMYKLLGQHIVGSRGSLELKSMLVKEHEALLSRPTWYEMTLMDEERRLSDQSAADVAKKFSSSEEAVTVVEDLMDPTGCFSGSTFLIKSKC